MSIFKNYVYKNSNEKIQTIDNLNEFSIINKTIGIFNSDKVYLDYLIADLFDNYVNEINKNNYNEPEFEMDTEFYIFNNRNFNNELFNKISSINELEQFFNDMIQNKSKFNQKFLIMDFSNVNNNFIRNKIVQNIILNNRHLNITLILIINTHKQLSPHIRSNINYLFISRIAFISQAKSCYDSFNRYFGSFKTFYNSISNLNHEQFYFISDIEKNNYIYQTGYKEKNTFENLNENNDNNSTLSTVDNDDNDDTDDNIDDEMSQDNSSVDNSSVLSSTTDKSSSDIIIKVNRDSYIKNKIDRIMTELEELKKLI